MRHLQAPKLDSWLAAAPGPVSLLDVREPWEFEVCRIEGSRLIPLSQLPARLGELDADRRVVCVCRSGSRSGRATAWLRSHGIDAVNMSGGMQAWARAGHPIVDDQGRLGAVR